MTARFLLTAALGLFSISGCESSPGSDAEPAALDYDALAEFLLERLALQQGERVLLVAMPGVFDALVPTFREGVAAAGATDLGAWSVAGDTPEAWATDFTARLAAASDEGLVEVLAEVDAAVMMPGATVTHPVYAALQDVLRQDQGRTVHFHWAGAYALDGTLMDQTPEYDAFYQNVLHETDYVALAAAQAGFERSMRASDVRVTTPAGTDISFRIGNRPVTKQDGNAAAARAERALNLIDREIELPAGAIRVAPLEESVRGTIAFPPTVWGGTTVEGLVLTFASGRVVEARAEQGLDAVIAEAESAGRSRTRVPRVRAGVQPAPRGLAGGWRMDPLLRLRRGRSASLARGQFRARGRRRWRLRALELLHRRHRHGRRRSLGGRRAARPLRPRQRIATPWRATRRSGIGSVRRGHHRILAIFTPASHSTVRSEHCRARSAGRIPRRGDPVL